MLAAARPAGTKATVMVTIGLADLKNRTRPGVLVGGVDTGTLLGPDTVRRLACDAALIPVLLDTERQLLRLGRTRRTFTSAQIRALWLRDRHCTFPGCRAPATWTDAHHLRHWADGGDTDLTNATLLCERHHTIVHRDRLHATLTTTEKKKKKKGSRVGSATRQLRPSPRPRTLTRTSTMKRDEKGEQRHRAQRRRRPIAHAVSSCRDDSWSLRSTDDTWVSTVLIEMKSSLATSLYW